MEIRQVPNQSGDCLIKISSCLIDQASTKVKSGGCLIDQAAARLKSASCLIDQDPVCEKSRSWLSRPWLLLLLLLLIHQTYAAASPNLLLLQLKLHRAVVRWQVTHDTFFFRVGGLFWCYFLRMSRDIASPHLSMQDFFLLHLTVT